jgi:hypothetical protein
MDRRRRGPAQAARTQMAANNNALNSLVALAGDPDDQLG